MRSRQSEPGPVGTGTETPDGATDDAVSAGITVVSGTPTPVELAAVTAVITAMSQELSDADEQAASPRRSAWQNSQRAVRQPHLPGPNAWRGFVG